LPEAFVARWDAWLQDGLAASREALGDDWLERYLNAPIWRFTLGPEALDDHGWTGLVMPSVDRVGRYFPLTIAVPGAADPSLVPGAREWYAKLETLALRALDPGSTVDTLEAELGALAEVPGWLHTSGDAAYALVEWWRDRACDAAVLELSDEAQLDTAFANAARFAFAVGLRGRSMWWCAPERRPAQLRCFSGLPPTGEFIALLGDGPRHEPQG
jgi:type VI secretion system protein ImpM